MVGETPGVLVYRAAKIHWANANKAGMLIMKFAALADVRIRKIVPLAPPRTPLEFHSLM
jgi:hypothetical protein